MTGSSYLEETFGTEGEPMTDRHDPRAPWDDFGPGGTPGGPNGPRGGHRMGWLWALAATLALTVLVGWLASLYPGALDDDDSQIRLVRLGALLVLVCAGVVGMRRVDLGTAAKQALAWVAIGFGLVLLYSFRDELGMVRDRVAAEVLPHEGAVGSTGEVVFRRGDDRHFHVEAVVDGVPLRFMVDTGASDVVLSPRDARRIGIAPGSLTFNRIYSTANGRVTGAPVRLAELRVGPIRLRDLRASVNGADMAQSLLGMSFLDRLGGYEVRGDRLILRP